MTPFFCHGLFWVLHQPFVPTLDAVGFNCLYRCGSRTGCLPVEDVSHDLFWTYLLYMGACILYQRHPYVLGQRMLVWDELPVSKRLCSPQDECWLLQGLKLG